MQPGKYSHGRIRPFGQSAQQDEHAINAQQQADEKPNRNHGALFHGGYQKIHCKISKIAIATAAQNTGRANNFRFPSVGNSVRP